MPQLQLLVLKDRQAPPVDHTFTPSEIDKGVGVCVESSGVPIGNNRFTISLRQNANRRYVGTVKLALPVVQNQIINGVTTPTVVRTAYVEATFTFEPTSTEAERNNAVGIFADSLATTKALVNDTLVKLQGVY